MKEEIWVPVKDWEDTHLVSNKGRVRCIRAFRGEKPLCLECSVMTGFLDGGDYRAYMFSYRGRKIRKKGHRLVAEAFIPNPENKPQVNHINSIKDDNRVENLEWATAEENLKHSFREGSHKRRRTPATPEEKAEILRLWNEGKLNQREISVIMKVSHSYVHQTIKKVRKQNEKQRTNL